MIILIGESGSGKTTILNELVKRGFQKAINHTTRKKRDKEEQNDEYLFVTKEEFEQMWTDGKLLQRAEFNGEHYGISVNSLKDNVVCIQIPDSVTDVKKRAKEFGMQNMKIITFYVHVPAEERTRRMLARGDSIELIQKRLEIDNKKFKNAKDVADYVIENKVLENALNEILEKVWQNTKPML